MKVSKLIVSEMKSFFFSSKTLKFILAHLYIAIFKVLVRGIASSKDMTFNNKKKTHIKKYKNLKILTHVATLQKIFNMILV